MRFCAVTLFCTALFFGCDSSPKMEKDIEANFIWEQANFDLSDTGDEFIQLLAKSFGISENHVREIRERILSKKTTAKLRADDLFARSKILAELERQKSPDVGSFVVNILAPYLNDIVGKRTAVLERETFALFGKIFSEGSPNTLERFVETVKAYNAGGTFHADFLNDFNETLARRGFFADYIVESNVNILKISDTLLPPTHYRNDSVTILLLSRITPSLMDSKSGYATIGSSKVIVLDDMLSLVAESHKTELDSLENFAKYTDPRFEKFWHSIGLDLSTAEASRIYLQLLEKDFREKSMRFLKESSKISTAIHEAKHAADRIDHPELTLNIDAEFSAHATTILYAASPNAELASAIIRMENFAYHIHSEQLNSVVKDLWNLARQATSDQAFTNDSLRNSVRTLYQNYRTLREGKSFEPLDEFENQIVSGLVKKFNR